MKLPLRPSDLRGNRFLARFLVIASLIVTALPARADPLQYAWRELAPGVWAGIRENSPRIPVMGTTTFVVGEDGVLVFDGGGLPLMSERAIGKIRSVTGKPVTHVAVSHWHQDHNYGIGAFRDAWPGVRIVSHPYTREALIRANTDDGGRFEERVHTTVSRTVPVIEEMLEADAYADGTAFTERDRRRFQQFLDDARFLDGEYKRIDPAYPDLTFERSLVVHLGNREVHLRHLGRGNTGGDIVMWLPGEKIVATGDLVVRPTPYGFGSYPREWAETLRRVKALGYELLIPGHGDIQNDAEYVDLLIETLESVAAQMDELVAKGLSEDEAAAALDLSSVEERFTGGDEFLARRFEVWFKRPIAQAAFRIEKGESPEVIE